MPPSPSPALLQLFAKLKSGRPLLKRIPKGARHAAAVKFSSILEKIQMSNQPEDWIDLFAFGYRVLHIDKDVDVKQSLVTQVKENISTFDSVALRDLRVHPRKNLRLKAVRELLKIN